MYGYFLFVQIFCFSDACPRDKYTVCHRQIVGTLLAPSLFSSWDNIGQKPEPTCLFFTKRARSRDLASKQHQYESLIVKNKSEPISIDEIVRICYVW